MTMPRFRISTNQSAVVYRTYEVDAEDENAARKMIEGDGLTLIREEEKPTPIEKTFSYEDDDSEEIDDIEPI